MADIPEVEEIVKFLEQYKISGELKHLEQAKIATDAIYHNHRQTHTERSSIQVVTNQMVPQQINTKSTKHDVFIKPTTKK